MRSEWGIGIFLFFHNYIDWLLDISSSSPFLHILEDFKTRYTLCTYLKRNTKWLWEQQHLSHTERRNVSLNFFKMEVPRRRRYETSLLTSKWIFQVMIGLKEFALLFPSKLRKISKTTLTSAVESIFVGFSDEPFATSILLSTEITWIQHCSMGTEKRNKPLKWNKYNGWHCVDKQKLYVF